MRRDLIVAWMAVAFDVLWQCHLTKKTNKKKHPTFPLIHFLETTVICWHAPPPASLTCMFYSPSATLSYWLWSKLELSFLFYATVCFHFEDKGVFVCRICAARKCQSSDCDIRTGIWRFLCSALRVRWHPSLCSNVTEEQNSGVKI